METNAVLVQQIYRLMEAYNRISIKQGKQSYPLPAVSIVDQLNRDMLLSFRAYLIYKVHELDPHYKLSSAGITVDKGTKMYVPIKTLPLKWPPEEDTKIVPLVAVSAKPKIE